MTGRLVVLASGSGTNLQAILDACDSGRLPARVVAVFSDRKAAFALERARKYDIPTIYHPWKPYRDSQRTRQAYDAELAELVTVYSPDLIVLAGWMRILTMSFLECFPMQVINLHPALPGTFPGTHAIQRAYDAFLRGEIEKTGVMVHFVPDDGVDDGPVIAQEMVPIHLDDTQMSLEERIHTVEHHLLVQSIRNVLLKISPSG
jgi:formyltetrahydrofolate-dependent phosphoribosylglycinamide formyltransferase